MSSNLSNTSNKKLSAPVVWFLKIVFTNSDEYNCAEAIFLSLPLETATGKQNELVRKVVPTRPYRYWRVRKKLLNMKAIKKGKTYGENGINKVQAYVIDEEFIKRLNSLRNSLIVLGNFGKPKQLEDNLTADL